MLFFGENDRNDGLVAVIPLTYELREKMESSYPCHLFDFTDNLGRVNRGILTYSDGSWLAFENTCPHRSQPFVTCDGEEGFVVKGDIIECLHHGATFSVQDGMGLPGVCEGMLLHIFDVEEAFGELRVYEKRIDWMPKF